MNHPNTQCKCGHFNAEHDAGHKTPCRFCSCCQFRCGSCCCDPTQLELFGVASLTARDSAILAELDAIDRQDRWEDDRD